MSDPKEYTVAWICAISTEFTAAQNFLDEKQEVPEGLSAADNNAYVVGLIGKHKVVIAALPDGEYGLSSATSVAKDILHSFPNIKVGLMVGIGGGAPSAKHDIRLGDVVVSATRDGKGGVFQYDFGKTVQNQRFQSTGFLNQSPILLRTALTVLRSDYENDGHQIQKSIDNILEKKPRLQKKYQRPSSDRLYHSKVVHPINNTDHCIAVCGDMSSDLVIREERTDDIDQPVIHYGLIASSNQLMKDASIRDRLAMEGNDVLCFEMEAAGLMNHFPCIVIRGICDYADSHKNKEWQGYAAMAAAAYAKDLLLRIHPKKIEVEKKIGDILSGLQTVAEDHKIIAKEQLELQHSMLEYRLSEKQDECLQLFRLATATNTTYEWYKNRIEAQVKGTCNWFLGHDHFQKWLKADSGPLLVSADPGCGKSVLAKYLIDDILPHSSPATICYFFFKDQDQNTARQAVCALLHQMFSQKEWLIKYAMEEFKKNGRHLVNLVGALWKIFEKATQDPQTGPVIIVLDALDECMDSEFADLIRNIKVQIHSAQINHRKLKFLLTSRPYEQITNKFRDLQKAFPSIHIPGEEVSEVISQEITCVIQHRVKQLSNEKGLSGKVETHLALKLGEVTHRTYLWVFLVFDYLQTKNFKKTIQGIDHMFENLPRNVYEAYEGILNKSEDDQIVRRALSVIFIAKGPLTLSQMKIALAIDDKVNSFHDLDLEEDEDFKSRLRTCCGLFVSVYQERVYFLHQTARAFLAAQTTTPVVIPSELVWQHSISSQGAHELLAKICVRYIDLFNNDFGTLEAGKRGVDFAKFIDYASTQWGNHYRQGWITAKDPITSSTLRICLPGSGAWSTWSKRYWDIATNVPYGWTKNVTSITVCSYLGLEHVVNLLLDKGAEIETKDIHGRTPLSWAAGNPGRHEHRKSFFRVLYKSPEFETIDIPGEAPLEYEAVIKLLLDRGAEIETKDIYGQTPLSWAALEGHETIVKLLLQKGADIEAKGNDGLTPLSSAAHCGNETAAKLLLKCGAHLDTKDGRYARTPLSWAAERGHETLVQLLLEEGADIDTTDMEYGTTPLSWAIRQGHGGVVQLLLANGADFETGDIYGRTPLFWALRRRDETIVKLLRGLGAT